MHQVPFPDDFRCQDRSFDLFLQTLKGKGVGPERIAGVMTETYQGGGASFAPRDYIQALAKWCLENDILLIFDEIQAAFGRTGTLFGFEHYGVVPDLVCLGKGISSSLPVSAVLGKSRIMDLNGPAEMTSTHTGNPVCAAAALANIDVILKENLVEHARQMGDLLHHELGLLKNKYSQIIGAVHGEGLVAGLHIVKRDSKQPDGELAFRIVQKAVEKGVMLFAPVGFGGATMKISPPLCITRAALEDSLMAFDEAISAAFVE